MRNTLKKAAIIGGLEAISRFRLGRLFPHVGGRGLIFTLHHVRPKIARNFEPNDHLEVTPEFLDITIRKTLAEGLVPVRLADLPERLADPDDTRRFVAFTLDDGYRNNAEHAAPIFRRHQVPYTIFVTTGFVHRTAPLWWEVLALLTQCLKAFPLDIGAGETTFRCTSHRERVETFNTICRAVNGGMQDVISARLSALCAANGIDTAALVDDLVMTEAELRALADTDPLADFGGHTLTHPVLSRLDDERLEREIGQSMRDVAAMTGRTVSTFAYPYGTRCAYDQRAFSAAERSGAKIAVTTRPGVLTQDSLKQPMAINRVSLNGLYQKAHYVPALISGIPFKLKS